MSRKQNVYGEGNYEASRKYDEATKRFVESGRVGQAARDAKPRNAREAAEMQQAEEAGRRRAKEAGPAVSEPPTRRPAAKEPERNPEAPGGKKAGAPPSRGRRQP